MTSTVDALCLEGSLHKNNWTDHEVEAIILFFIRQQNAEKVRNRLIRRSLIAAIMFLVVIMLVMVWQVPHIWKEIEPECMPEKPPLDIVQECIKLRAFSWENPWY